MKNEMISEKSDKRNRAEISRFDTKEFDFPETVFSCNIEEKVFQSIILQCLANIDGISPVGGNFIDSILGRSGPEGIKGVNVGQDSKNHTIDVKIEINICYGNSIPEKAGLIQNEVSKEITRLTGLHVSSIHVVFKNVISYEQMKKLNVPVNSSLQQPQELLNEEYNDEF
jgi:uncharacterized alkaline shock family protein YloU